jgi:dinuclear metal center YbgI/SA1388 family protein
MLFIKDILAEIEKIAPLALQEDYDNSGLMVGDVNQEVKGALLCLDITEEILKEAILKKYNLIISHHPIIFKGLKCLDPSTRIGKIIIDAVKHNVVLYAAHTNLDNAHLGVSYYLAQRLGLIQPVVLDPAKEGLRKLVTFCPVDFAEKVRSALFEAGAGHIGNYDSCSYNIDGTGTFRALGNSHPFVGQKGEIHYEAETRIEVIYPAYIEKSVIKSLKTAHPYEEVAFDIYNLQNENSFVGCGVVAELTQSTEASDFLNHVKNVLGLAAIKYSAKKRGKIKKVALCGGSGGFLINNAICSNADIYITGDLKYHDFTDYSHQIILADIGHFESEQFVREQIREILIKKFPTFAVSISESEESSVCFL